MKSSNLGWGVSHKISGEWVLLGRYSFGAEAHTAVYGGYRTAVFNTRKEARENVRNQIDEFSPKKSFRVVKVKVEVTIIKNGRNWK